MCCRCCTTLKVAATWGASIHISVGLLLLLRYFLFHEILGDYQIPYLVYIGLIIPVGVGILFGVQREIGWLVKGGTWLFIIFQIFGFAIRLLIPTEVHSLTILQRISALFLGILTTAIYSAILILYARKLAHHAAATAASAALAGTSRSAIEGQEEQPITTQQSATTHL